MHSALLLIIAWPFGIAFASVVISTLLATAAVRCTSNREFRHSLSTPDGPAATAEEWWRVLRAQGERRE